MDTTAITTEKAELLRNDFWPTAEEVELINDRVDDGQKLAPLDVFLHKLSLVERGKMRLTLMMEMESCAEASLKRVSHRRFD